MPDPVLEAADSGRPNVYVLGPFGRRVSFASQQRRALRLARSLAVARPPNLYPEAAVVGAGVGGVMLATALKAKGYTVALYESEAEALSLQARSLHRYLHPSLNFWPYDTVDVSTTLPYFDWYAGSCVDVIDQLRSQWDTIKGKVAKFLPNEIVEDLDHHNNTVTVVAKNRITARVSRLAFNTVVFATGFGVEKNYDDDSQRAYWDNDHLEDYHSTSGKRLVVTGAGDGGVIDFLRLVHVDFNYGQLAIDLLNDVDDVGSRRLVYDVEEEGFRLFKNEKFDELSEYYFSAYTGLLRIISDDMRTKLDRSLSTKNFVSIIGLYKYPFEYNSSPINKLMLAHALMDTRKSPKDKKPYITFTSGKVERIGDVYKRRHNDGKFRQIICDKIVVRHGSTPATKRIISNDARYNTLKVIQETAIDLLVEISDDQSEFSIEHKVPRVPARRPNCMRFAESRGLLSDSYGKAFHNAAAWPIFKRGKIHFYIDIQSERYPKNLGRIPASLFGFPVTTDGGKAARFASVVARTPGRPRDV
jgi:hypothetical protein